MASLQDLQRIYDQHSQVVEVCIKKFLINKYLNLKIFYANHLPWNTL